MSRKVVNPEELAWLIKRAADWVIAEYISEQAKGLILVLIRHMTDAQNGEQDAEEIESLCAEISSLIEHPFVFTVGEDILKELT
jgi:hypothetical protein